MNPRVIEEMEEWARERAQRPPSTFTPIDKPKDPPWAPPFDGTDCPELACAVTGHVDADPICTCAGCSAARVRAR